MIKDTTRREVKNRSFRENWNTQKGKTHGKNDLTDTK